MYLPACTTILSWKWYKNNTPLVGVDHPGVKLNSDELESLKCVTVLMKILLSHHMGKPTICIGENKGADQLRGKREADHAFIFATRIVQFLFYLNPKGQNSRMWDLGPVNIHFVYICYL